MTARPRSRYVASLVGVNLLAGTAVGGVITLDSGAHLVAGESSNGHVLAVIAPLGHVVSPTTRWQPPQRVAGDRDGPGSSTADRVRVQLAGPVPLVAEITTGALGALALAPGHDIWATVKATDVTVSPA